MNEKEIETFYPADQQAWRKWLAENHDKKQGIWLICYKMKTGIPTISWSDAVDEALCFGWIDSTRKSVDDQQFIQFFTRRKPNSAWSKINKEKVDRLIREGLMTPAGHKSIEVAKENGSWNILDEVEELTIPEDLEQAFAGKPGSGEFFSGLSKSVRKRMLQWLVLAKRPETRQKRIGEIADMSAQQLRPEQFR